MLKQNMKKALSLVLVICMVISMLPVFAFGANAEGTQETPVVVIAGGDFQNTALDHSAGAAVVQTILNQITKDYPAADGFISVGDYTYDFSYENGKLGKETFQSTVKAQYPDMSMDKMVWTQGNHDNDQLVTDGVLSAGGAHDTGDYGVYVINEQDYMWYNDDEARIQQTANALDAYLDAKVAENYAKPIFVASHLPLHYSMRTMKGGGCGKHANYLFDVLNEAGAKGLNIIFMYGHNHSHGWDDYLGGAAVYLAKGDKINIAQNSYVNYQEETLNFTYMNPGFVGYYGDTGNGSDQTLTMTAFAITSDSVSVTRYDQAGHHVLKAAGVYGGEYPDADNALIPYATDAKVYESSQQIRLNKLVTCSDTNVTVAAANATAVAVDVADLTYDIQVAGYAQGDPMHISIPAPRSFDAASPALVLDHRNKLVLTAPIIDGKVVFATDHSGQFSLAQAGSGIQAQGEMTYLENVQTLEEGAPYVITSYNYGWMLTGTEQTSESQGRGLLLSGKADANTEHLWYLQNGNLLYQNDTNQYLHLSYGAGNIGDAWIGQITSGKEYRLVNNVYANESRGGTFTLQRTEGSDKYYLNRRGGSATDVVATTWSESGDQTEDSCWYFNELVTDPVCLQITAAETVGTALLSKVIVNGQAVYDYDISWTSSDSTVATVNQGYVNALRNGTVTVTATLNAVNGHKLAEPVSVDYSLTVEADEEMISDDNWFYLSDFSPMEKVSTGWGETDYLAINEGYFNWLPESWLCTEMAQQQVKVDRGMTIQAPGKIAYDISHMNASRFTCLYGVNASHPSGHGTVGLKIYTDLNAPGEYLYSLNSAEDAQRLGVANFPIGQQDKAVKVDIAIPAGATRLYLEPTDGGNGNDSDHAIFAEPKLYADFVYLSNMEYTELSAGWGNAVYDNSMSGPIILNTLYLGTANGKSVVRPVTCDEGIGIHAPSSVTYNIEGLGVTRFTAFCGISTNSGDYNPTTTFKVYFDGVEAHSINKTRNDANIAIGENIDLEVPEGTQTITLTAQAVGSNDGNHTCWAYPRLFGDNLDKVQDLSLVIENEGLFLNKAQEVTIMAQSLRGERKLELAEMRLTAESDNITVDGNMVTATATGKALLKAEYIEDSVVLFSKTFELDIFDETTSWTVTSPDGNSRLTVFFANGKVFYSAEVDGKTYVHMSQLGLQTTAVDYSEGFEFVIATDSREIQETYDMPSGKFSTYENHCNERSVTFQKDGNSFGVVIRAYDDGVAFRYVLANEGDIEISDETTELVMPGSSYVWYQPNTGGKYPNTHEQLFGYGEAERYPFDITLPFMYKTPDGINVVVSEADLDGSYCGTVLQSISKTNLKFGFPEQQTNENYSKSTLVQAGANFESPWRAFVAGDEETIFMSTMFENLSDPSVVEDTSWITPGITAFSWMSGVLSGGNPYDYQANKDVIKGYIDLVAEMGWDYYILDEGWMTRISNEEAKAQGLTGGRDWLPNGGWYTGFYDYTQEVVDYATSKNVGLIAWVHVSQVNDPSNDYEQMDTLFAQFHEFGIKGIKVDFFNSENQETIQLYNAIYEKCAKYKLLANVHGSNKPTGERRTYPNVVNREAIYGEELCSTKASQMVIQAYARGLVGPTDLTPYIYPADKADTTMAQQLAFSVIYESGMTCFASRIDEYQALSDDLKEYFYSYPSVWHDSQFLGGTIGKDMTVARQSRDGRWYIGGITTAAKNETVVLDFLEEGVTYTAYIYTDNSRTSVNYEERTVQKGDQITATLSENGGFAVKLVKKDTNAAYVGEQGYETVTEAIAAAKGNTVKLMVNSDEVLTISADVTVDLAGCTLSNVTVAKGATLTLIDTATDDYKGEYGTATVTGTVETFAEVDGKTYMTVCEGSVYSAHCYGVAITHISLNPAKDALGYKAKLYGDEVVQQYVTGIGFNLWVNDGNVKTYTTTGKQEVTLRLQNILASKGGEMNINATAFVTLAVGEESYTKTGTQQTTTMKETLQQVNAAWASYTEAQQTATKALCDSYYDTVSAWMLHNIYPGAEAETLELKLEAVTGAMSLAGGFTVSNGQLTAPNNGEGKAILSDTPAGDKTVSVELHPNGSINSGIYLGASNASAEQDSIDGIAVIVESNDANDPNRIDVVIGNFPVWEEYHRYVIEGSSALFTNGVKEPVTLTVVQNGNDLTVTVALISDPSKSATTTYTYTGSYDLSNGQVGLRSQYNDCAFDNFRLSCGQQIVQYSFTSDADVEGLEFYHSVWNEDIVATSDDTLALHEAATFTNGVLTMDINTNGNKEAGVVFGADAQGSNYYLFRLTSDRFAQLVKVENGAQTVLASKALPAGHSPDSFNRLEVVSNGNQIACYYYSSADNANCYIVFEDAQALTGDCFGFWAKTAGASVWNITLSPM